MMGWGGAMVIICGVRSHDAYVNKATKAYGWGNGLCIVCFHHILCGGLQHYN